MDSGEQLELADLALGRALRRRAESEVAFVRVLLQGLGCDVSSWRFSPAYLLRLALGTEWRGHLLSDVLQVIGTPFDKAPETLRAGDWMIRVVPGSGDIGHICVLASSELLSRAELRAEGIPAESSLPGYYGAVIEGGAYPHKWDDLFARRFLDGNGRVAPHSVILRPRRGATDEPPTEALSPLAAGPPPSSRGQQQPAGPLVPSVPADPSRDEARPLQHAFESEAAGDRETQAVAFESEATETADRVPAQLTNFIPQPSQPGPMAGALAAATAAAAAMQRVDGVDTYFDNSMPTWANLRAAQIAFVIFRCSEQQAGGALVADNVAHVTAEGHVASTAFPTRWKAAGDNNFIRGSYHFYRYNVGAPRATTGDDQARIVADVVVRLVPGDLAPALDVEGKHLTSAIAGDPSAEDMRLDLELFLDGVEKRLGRTPWVYTGYFAFQEAVGSRPDYRAANFDHFADYPLWVKVYPYVNVDSAFDHRDYIDPTNIPPSKPIFPRNWVPAPWARTWDMLQYLGDGLPSAMRSYGFAAKTDWNVTRGGLFVLRGLADLGHTAPHMAGRFTSVAYADENWILRLRKKVQGWQDEYLPPDAPLAKGDVAAAFNGDTQTLLYRHAVDGHVIALSRKLSDPARWTVTDVSDATRGAGAAVAALDDPFLTVANGAIHVVHRDANDHQTYLLTDTAGHWHADDLTAGTSMATASGSAVLYIDGIVTHVVARAGADGHLVDFHRDGVSGLTHAEDLTAMSRDSAGRAPPAATYRPSAYLSAPGDVRIVFRALRGELWEIARSTNLATNLTQAAVGSPRSAGSPSVVLVGGRMHVLYRIRDGRIVDLFDAGGGAFQWREVGCEVKAAADPTSYLDGVAAAVTFRAVDGTIQRAVLRNGMWTCEDTTPSSYGWMAPNAKGAQEAGEADFCPGVEARGPGEGRSEPETDESEDLLEVRETLARLPSPVRSGAVSLDPIEGEIPMPSGVPRFRHFFQRMKPGSGGPAWVADGDRAPLEPINPGFIDGDDNLIEGPLQRRLADILTGSDDFKPYLTPETLRTGKPHAGDKIQVALVDLTGKKLTKPEFAGFGSTVGMEIGSSAKIAPLYAAFQLLSDLKHLAAEKSVLTVAALATEAAREWQTTARGDLPNVAAFLDAAADPPSLAFSAAVRTAVANIINNDHEDPNNANHSASELLRIIGFPYSASLLWQSGLRHPRRGGLWPRWSFEKAGPIWTSPVLPAPGPFPGHAGTALSLATFFTLLAQGRLVNASSSEEMKKHLSTASFFQKNYWSGTPIPDAAIASKVGLILRCAKWIPKLQDGKRVISQDGKPAICCDRDSWVSDLANEGGLIENGKFRYAVAIMTTGIDKGVHVLQQVIGPLNSLISAQNP
jgi:GH25 family lysozyme M1 (1,4-beta-N-acetylmuramidase)